jgi:hypothetical protein
MIASREVGVSFQMVSMTVDFGEDLTPERNPLTEMAITYRQLYTAAHPARVVDLKSGDGVTSVPLTFIVTPFFRVYLFFWQTNSLHLIITSRTRGTRSS